MLRHSRICLRRQELSNQLACIQAVSNPELLTYDPIPQIWANTICSSPRHKMKLFLTHCLSWPAGKLFRKDPSRARPQPLQTLHTPMRLHSVHALMLCILKKKRRLGQELVVLNGYLSTLCQRQGPMNSLQQMMEVSNLTNLSLWEYWLLEHLSLCCLFVVSLLSLTISN